MLQNTNQGRRLFVAAGTLVVGLIASVVPVAAADEIPEDRPNAPINVVAEPSPNKIVVTWDAPIDGPAVFDYLAVVTERDAVGTPLTSECQRDATSNGAPVQSFECDFTGLLNDRAYRVRVRSRNAIGVRNAPPENVLLGVAPPTFPFALTGDESILVKWGKPTLKGFGHGSDFSYTVTLAPGGHPPCRPTALECVFGELTNDVEYRATLTSHNSHGTSQRSIIVATPTADAPSVIPVPNPPTDIEVEVGDKKLTIVWSAPTSGSAVDDYLVDVDEGDQSCVTTALRCVLTGLTNGTDYQVRVASRNKGGSTSVSAGRFTPRPPGFAERLPNRPTKIEVTPADGSVTVSWVASQNEPGAEVDDYVVSVEPGGHSCTTTELTCSIGGLTNGTEYTLRVRARNEAGLRSGSPATFTPLQPGPPIVAMAPQRIFETRIGPKLETADGEFQNTGSLKPRTRKSITMAGRVGIPADAKAVVVNVTAIAPTGGGFVTLYPCTVTPPTASTLNYSEGQTIANSTVVRLSGQGTLCVYSSSKMEMAIDVTGFVPANSDLVASQPARLYESRTGERLVTVDGKQQNTGRLKAGDVVSVNVGGRGTLPQDMAAAMLNVAVVDPSDAGFLTLYPCDEKRPTASTLNHAARQTIANGVTVKLDSHGDVCIFSRSAADVIVDFLGYAPATSSLSTVTPARLYESRAGNKTVDGKQQGTGRRSARQITVIEIAGRAGVPVDAGAAIVNVAAVGPAAPGYLTLFPCNEDRPLASTLNFAVGHVVANGATVKLDPAGNVCAFTLADSDLIVDVTGYLPA